MPERRQSERRFPEASPGVDLREVERLLEFMEKHGLEECEYQRGDLRIRLKKPGAGPAPSLHSFGGERLTTSAAAITAVAAAEAMPAASASEERAKAAEAEELHVIKSPIVGTYYSAPSPGAGPFARIGEHVQAGQVLCIVEAMKLMNEIEADIAGTLRRAFVQNGKAVEYGEALFAIAPD